MKMSGGRMEMSGERMKTSGGGLKMSGGIKYRRRGPHEEKYNRRSSEIQGTALGKCLRAWSCTYRSTPTGVAQSRHAFVGGTVSTWAR